jgi:hypothetical protein
VTRLAAASVVTGVIAGLVRLAAAKTLPNDHYFYVAGANQVLAGEWPTRDFFDPGMPLMYLVPAFVQWLVGYPLLAEVLVVSLAYGVAAALTVVAGYRLTGCLPIGIVTAVLEVLAFPRTYNYPKVVFYVAGLLLIWRYLRAPTTTHLVSVAVLVAIAGMFRHDHALYLGVVAVIAVMMASSASLGQRLRRGLALAVVTAALLTPYVVYVQVNSGVMSYARALVEFNRAERRRTRLQPVTFVTGRELGAVCGASSRFPIECVIESNAEPILYYGLFALPAIAVVVLAVRRVRRRQTDVDVMVVTVVATALLLDLAFLRHPLSARLADPLVPALLLSAWLGRLLWRPPGWTRRTVAAMLTGAVLTLSIVSFARFTGTADYLGRTGLLINPARFPEFLWNAVADLSDVRSSGHLPSRAIEKLEPFWRYVDWCTEADHRILVPGFMAEIVVVARRPFAGGRSTLMPGFNNSVEDQELVLSRLARQTTPIVVVMSDWAGWEQSFPLVARYVAHRYSLAGELPIREDRIARVLLADDMTAGAPLDPETGWPCIAAGPARPGPARSPS